MNVVDSEAALEKKGERTITKTDKHVIQKAAEGQKKTVRHTDKQGRERER